MTYPKFARGEIVANECGRIFSVKSQTADLVWAAPTDGTACGMCASPFNARKLYLVDGGIEEPRKAVPEQYPREARP